MSACTIHQASSYSDIAKNAPQTADVAHASANCFEASTPVETAICVAPALIAANRLMIQAEQPALRRATIFERDSLVASQRAWLLALPAQCPVPAATPQAAQSCLQNALAERTAVLRDWPAALPPVGAIAQNVSLRASAGAGAQPDPAFCAAFARRAQVALRRVGTLDPGAMGFQEVGGTHGPQAASSVSVDLYDFNVFALFQRRARSISFGSSAIITPVSLTDLVESQHTANQGGRLSAFASQTGDYGSLDVFRDNNRTQALAADPWGYTTPAAQGEAAHAGVWDISSSKPSSLYLFDTYTRPAGRVCSIRCLSLPPGAQR